MTKLKMLLVTLIAAFALSACAGMNNTNATPVGSEGAFPAGTHDYSPD